MNVVLFRCLIYRVEVIHFYISTFLGCSIYGNKYEIFSVFSFYYRCNPLDISRLNNKCSLHQRTPLTPSEKYYGSNESSHRMSSSRYLWGWFTTLKMITYFLMLHFVSRCKLIVLSFINMTRLGVDRVKPWNWLRIIWEWCGMEWSCY